jgi:cyclohexa-1,5-dienecarbonyl-CoA hydratase
MSYETLTIREMHDDAVCEVTLNTPPANILTAQMLGEIETCLNIENTKTERKLIIFKGVGKHFSFGASVEEHQHDQVANMLPAFHRVLGKVLSQPIPTLAQVTGQCLGGGFELALVCTFIMADENARFAVPEIQLGVFPPVAALLLPQLISSTLANEMVLTGSKYDAKTLNQAGLINNVSVAGALDDDIATFVEKHILPKSAHSLRIAHRAARNSMTAFYNAHIGELENLYLEELMASRDANEGIAAFLEKRPVRWANA